MPQQQPPRPLSTVFRARRVCRHTSTTGSPVQEENPRPCGSFREALYLLEVILSTMHELIIAARIGSTKRVLDLLSRRVIDINQGDPNGNTPLMYATLFNHPHIVRILLDNGAHASVADKEGDTAVHISAREGRLAVTKILVRAGADLSAKSSQFGTTPLQQAAQAGHLEVMSVLIEAGADPNSRRVDGGIAVHRGQARIRGCDQVAPSCGSEPTTNLYEPVRGSIRPSGRGGSKRALGGSTRAGPGAWDQGLWWCMRRCERPSSCRPEAVLGNHERSDQRRSGRYGHCSDHRRRLWPRIIREVSVAAESGRSRRRLPELPYPFRGNALGLQYAGLPLMLSQSREVAH